ncbi:carboxylesterase/lipase family protein [soil metagenome]
MAESIVSTTSGGYRGVHVDGVHSFLGMRYGSDTRSVRFRPASPALPHDGIADALAFGPAALQFDSRLLPAASRTGPSALYFPRGQQTEGMPVSEDCLTLNVWTPTVEPGARLPVMVWFHGGAFRVGSAAASVTHGANLAATGRAVIVTVNHRLGIPGFLALGHLLGDDYAQSGVAGLTDLVLALEWVAENAASFGGDPGNVTIFGQSGGGGKVHALLRSARAHGLFQRAIMQSGAGDVLSPEAGIEQTDRILGAAGVTARELIDCDPSLLLHAQSVLSGDGFAPSPVADGDVVDPTAALDPVPVLIGHTTHDWSFLIAEAPWYAALSENGIADALAPLNPTADSAVVADYRARYPDESAQLLYSRIATDLTFGNTAGARAGELVTAGSPVYRYEFGYPELDWPVPLGATHCIEVPFVFDTVDWSRIAGDRPDRFDLAREVSGAWLAFAETGVPVLPHGTTWPRYVEGTASTVFIDAPEWSVVTSAPNS